MVSTHISQGLIELISLLLRLPDGSHVIKVLIEEFICFPFSTNLFFKRKALPKETGFFSKGFCEAKKF